MSELALIACMGDKKLCDYGKKGSRHFKKSTSAIVDASDIINCY